jgi:hypothetical protein
VPNYYMCSNQDKYAKPNYALQVERGNCHLDVALLSGLGYRKSRKTDERPRSEDKQALRHHPESVPQGQESKVPNPRLPPPVRAKSVNSLLSLSIVGVNASLPLFITTISLPQLLSPTTITSPPTSMHTRILSSLFPPESPFSTATPTINGFHRFSDPTHAKELASCMVSRLFKTRHLIIKELASCIDGAFYIKPASFSMKLFLPNEVQRELCNVRSMERVGRGIVSWPLLKTVYSSYSNIKLAVRHLRHTNKINTVRAHPCQNYLPPQYIFSPQS